MKEQDKNLLHTYFYNILRYILYLKPSHCVEQRDVNSGELLKREKQEEYRHGFPSGRFKKSPPLIGRAAVFAPPLLVQFNLILLHNIDKLRLGH